MRRLLLCLLVAVALLAAAPKKPKLVVAIVLDQYRYDYTTRQRADYSGGLERLLSRGAVFADARYIHYPTVTAVGHSTVLSGALPAVSGIVGNEWFDPEAKASVTSVSDPATQLLGASGTGASPRRLLVDDIGDELKFAGGSPRVFSISLKDRAAILPGGHLADGAFWFDATAGAFVSSTYYFPELPAWVREFNATRPADGYAGKTWVGHTLPKEGRALYSAVDASPFANDMVERLAEQAFVAEKLGQRGDTDLLFISFSAHDYVGHTYGPLAPEERETSIVTDKVLDRLFQLIDKTIGMDNVVVALTADHGVAPVPPTSGDKVMPGGRIAPDGPSKAVAAALTLKYGEGAWVVKASDLQLYLNRDLAAQRGINAEEMRAEAARAVKALPHVARVYTRDDLLKNQVIQDEVTRRVMNGYNERRGADLSLILDPYWMLGTSGTTHGSPFSYDNHVPLIIMGTGIRPGIYFEPVVINDLAPTLAAILSVETPSGSVGRVLSEIFAPETK